MKRSVAVSMFPEIVPDKAVGPILKSVFRGTNAELMAAVAPLYLSGSVLDVTYGDGHWWDRFTPEPFTYHDLYKVDGVDFTNLPEADCSSSTVCFDPPYVPAGGAPTQPDAARHRGSFGLTPGRTVAEFDRMVFAGLAECARVAETFLLVKCMEFVGSARFCDMPTDIITGAQVLGWELHDRIVHDTGTGPGGHNIFTVKRARRAHSYLLVFTRSSDQRVEATGNDRDGAS